MFESQQQPNHKKQKPHSFQKKKKKSQSNNNAESSQIGRDNYSVTATTSKSRAPLPPNQEKKINNKRAAKKKREKSLEIESLKNLEISRQKGEGCDTPLSSTSESSTTRALLVGMDLRERVLHLEDDQSSFSDENYQELPCDTLILNTETVEKIIEQIETDIESEVEIGPDSQSDSDEFGGEEALNAGVQRYFLEKSGPKCFNCGESGHVLKD